ncbi:sulfurtransferase complex subunit TusB [Buchnera aphidicola]|uniref:sulfurtransferase complex subunit TusB n=1 Tax=Buchnera aphidicola TaxID=9 RepID=UPI0034648013
MLHILMNSPFQVNFNSILKFLNSMDDFVALQDGVLISIRNNTFFKGINLSNINLYLLREDVIARGILNKVSDKFHIINYSELIILTEKHKLCMNW